MDRPMVGICMCSHNDQTTIERAIESLLNNTHKPNIIVIGDNNSNDHTYKILCELLGAEMIEKNGHMGWPAKFEGQLNGIKIIIFRSQTVYAAKILNHCFKMLPMNITIIGFLCCSDWYGLEKIAQSLSIFGQHKSVSCVVSDYNQYITATEYVRRFNKSFSYHKLLKECIYDKNFFISVASMKILKCGFDESLSAREEYELLLRISEVGLIYHIPKALHNCSHKIASSLLQHENHIREITIKRRLQNA